MLISPQNLRDDGRLAVNGGRPPLAVPYDYAAALRKDERQPRPAGPKVEEFGRRLTALLGRREALFHASGGAALLTALDALGVDESKNVAISCSGFASSIHAAFHMRGRPVFLPTDERTLLCRHDAGPFVDEPIEVLLVSHSFGNVVDVDEVMRATGARHLLEDASQALGARLRGRHAGSFGVIATLAGSNRKLLGSISGGINVCDEAELAERMRSSAYGRARTLFSPDPGLDWREGEMQAALALFFLDVLAEKARERAEAVEAFRRTLAGSGLTLAQPPHGDCAPAWFDIPVILPPDWIGHRDWLVSALNQEGIPAWKYPSLIELPWLKPWMQSKGWWGDREEELLRRENRLWARVFVVGGRMTARDAALRGELLASLLCR